jgi:Ala-tRNA(Pro) deacylase
MTVLDNILEKLDKAKIEYKKIEHEPVYTSEQAAAIRDADMSMGAKAIICFADKNPCLIVVPGDKKIGFKEFKIAFGVKDLRMASADEVKLLTGIEIGAIPPVGSAMSLQAYFDDAFNEKQDVAFNAGSHTVSVLMKAEDLIKIEKPIFGKFAVSRI